MIRALFIAITFLTRVPLPAREVQPSQFGAATGCFPAVGFAIGAIGFALYGACHDWLGLPLTGCLIVAYSALITGGLHLDGLADWFDALGGGRGERTRMLEIMRDSRIGAHGAVALVIVLGTRLVAWQSLPPSAAAMALLGAPAVARCSAVWLLWALPSARSDGLAHGFTQHVRLRHVVFASATLAFGLIWFGPPVTWPLLLGTLAAGSIGVWAQRRLGGSTGDVIGTAIELAETLFLVGCTRPV